jgi:hypothetical protein
MYRLLLLPALLLQLIGFSQTDTATIMYYNVLNYPGSTGSRVQDFKVINQYIKPDFIVVTELLSDAGASTLLQQGLNVYGETKYQKAVFTDGPDTDNGLFYNSDKFTLYSQDTIGTALRSINEYVLFYNMQQPSADTVFFYLYVAHLKASTGFESDRLAEVMHFKSHVNNNPNIENMIFGGDLNFYNAASEPAYSAIINQGLYPLTDVLPAGNWHDNAAFAEIHTQSPRTASFGGGATGGLDDRFDFMFFSNDLLNGSNKVSYINNSYVAVGNDGQHLNKALIDLPANTLYPDSVVQAIYNMSDHLPIISKFAIHTFEAPQYYELSLRVLLEGPFNGTEMQTGINSILPLTSPFSQPPWNLLNNPSIESIPSQDIVDWILVELRDAPDAASATTGTIIYQQAGFLFRDGSIKGIDGITNLQFDNSISHQLFVVIRQRNHLGVMSAFPLSLSGNVFSYDFSVTADKAFLNGQKQIFEGTWGMIAGDVDADGQIDENDRTLSWKFEAGQSSYLSGDFNFDSEVDNSDKNGFLIINYQMHSNIPQ